MPSTITGPDAPIDPPFAFTPLIVSKSFGGHLFEWLGEISYFFPHALAAVVIFDRLGELEFVPGKLLILAAILFAVFCYKRQLESLGEQLIHTGATPH